MRNEREDALKMASLQSALGQELKELYEQGGRNIPDSILFYNEGMIYERSTAVLEVCKYLRWPFSMFTVFKAIPSPLRNGVYAWVARNRYKWFGKKETCRVPTEAEKAKILG